MSTEETSLSTPYARNAVEYASSGLGWPIPSQFPFEKMPPLKGWTGKRGGEPDNLRISEWSEQYPNSNILLRVKRNIIGIDVDAYNDKHGDTTFERVAKAHGHPGHTFKSTARGVGVSGIYFYRLAPNMHEDRSKGDFGPGSDIEVVRYSHRYAVVFPSWHQGAESMYRWYDPSGKLCGIPSANDLPLLPRGWWDHLTQRCACFERQREMHRLQLIRYKNRPANNQGCELAKLDFMLGIEELATMPEGGRNNYLSKLAGRTFAFDVLVNGVLDEYWVETTLWKAADTCGLDTEETRRTIQSAKEWAAHMIEGDER